jgi:hypothetical protein
MRGGGKTTFSSDSLGGAATCSSTIPWKRRVVLLNETCFYCGHEAEKGTYVTFYEKDLEHDEFLCRECYAEWLESMKG